MKWTAKTFVINSHRNYSPFIHRQLIFTGFSCELFHSDATQYGQGHWYCPSSRGRKAECAGTAPSSRGRQQCPKSAEGRAGTAGARALLTSGLKPPHGCGIHSLCGRESSQHQERWDFRRRTEATSAECALTLRWSQDENICPDFLLNRLTIAKGKAIKNLDFLMVWEQQ